MPGSGSFFSEFSIMLGSFNTNFSFVGFSIMFSFILGVYSLYFYSCIFFGRNSIFCYGSSKLHLVEFLVLLNVLIWVFITGFCSKIFSSFILNIVVSLIFL